MLTSLGKYRRIGTFHQLWYRLSKSGRQLHIWKILCPFMSMLMNLTINLFPVKNLPATQEPLVRSLSQEDPLEKEMASHSSILAWRILWIEEPGRPQYMGSQRVGHDSSDYRFHFLSIATETGAVNFLYTGALLFLSVCLGRRARIGTHL